MVSIATWRRSVVGLLVAATLACCACEEDGDGSGPGRDGASVVPTVVRDTGALRDDGQAGEAPEVRGLVDASCRHVPVEKNCRDGWCRIPAGCFIQGSAEEELGHPAYAEEQRAVTLTRDFEIQQYEVTQAAWTELGLPNPSGKLADGTGDCLESHCPVGNVTWIEAVAFANLLSERHEPPLAPCYVMDKCQSRLGEGLACSSFSTTTPSLYDCEGYRLPTDAEWEYAVRAGTTSTFYSGYITIRPAGTCGPDAALESIAWYCHNAEGQTHPVGQLEPNGWGLFDMAGNVLEWVNDAYSGTPPAETTDPGAQTQATARRTTRGGIFNGPSTYCRSAWQSHSNFGARGPGLGFRLVRTLGGAK